MSRGGNTSFKNWGGVRRSSEKKMVGKAIKVKDTRESAKEVTLQSGETSKRISNR